MNFCELEKYLNELVDSTGGIDTQIKVFKDNKEIYSFCGGFRDSEHKKAATFDDCFYFYSLSKPITCTAAMQLVERGKLDLFAPVSRYLPYFKSAMVKAGGNVRPAKNDILVWHLFSMQSGFNYDENSDVFKAAVARGADTNELLKITVENIPFSFDAGEHWQYACRNHDALGCIIEAVSGLPLREYLKKNIFEPLGMEHIDFTVDGFLKDNIADLYRSEDGKLFNTVPLVKCRGYTENYHSGGQGLIGNISSYAPFANALANGDTRILKPETLNLLRQDRLFDGIRPEYRLAPFGYGYGLGVRTLISKKEGALSPLYEFGWDGAAGAYTLMDTENRIALVFLTHCLAGNMKLDQFKIRDLTYKAIFE